MVVVVEVLAVVQITYQQLTMQDQAEAHLFIQVLQVAYLVQVVFLRHLVVQEQVELGLVVVMVVVAEVEVQR